MYCPFNLKAFTTQMKAFLITSTLSMSKNTSHDRQAVGTDMPIAASKIIPRPTLLILQKTSVKNL